ncbi:hypothetical protein F5Y18DRAFT_30288 [Xylariaceae sp. FL1019]|nr:hypothetical protein F5Y18DRAFT_30288 [Xylariaceae sp. FL1019]
MVVENGVWSIPLLVALGLQSLSSRACLPASIPVGWTMGHWRDFWAMGHAVASLLLRGIGPHKHPFPIAPPASSLASLFHPVICTCQAVYHSNQRQPPSFVTRHSSRRSIVPRETQWFAVDIYVILHFKNSELLSNPGKFSALPAALLQVSKLMEILPAPSHAAQQSLRQVGLYWNGHNSSLASLR